MPWIDYVILALLALSTLISLLRGFVREMLSLASWIAAFAVAGYFHPYVTPYLTTFQQPLLRKGIAISGLLLSTLLVGGLVNTLLGQLIVRVGLSTSDRLLGAFFGLSRGCLIVCALLFFWDRFLLGSQHNAWQQSQIIPYLDGFTQWFFHYLENLPVSLSID